MTFRRISPRQIISTLFVSLMIALPALANDTINIGATLTLTGSGSSWGKEALRGAELAAKEFNESEGGKLRKVKILPHDFGQGSGFDLKGAVSATEKLIVQDHVSLMLTQWAEDTAVVLPVAQKHGIPVIGFSAGSAPKNSANFISLWPSPALLVKATVAEIARLNLKRVAVITQEATYYLRLSDELKKEVPNADVHFINGSETDFRTLLGKLRAQKVDALVGYVAYSTLGIILRQARESQFSATIFGYNGCNDKSVREAAGEAAKGFIYPEYAWKDSDDFVSKYRAAYSEEPSVPASVSYDALKLFLISDFSKSSSERIEQIKTAPPRAGASGMLAFDYSGERQKIPVEIRVLK